MNRQAGLLATLTILAALSASALQAGGGKIEKIDYHGWPDSLIMENGLARVVIVPAIGRVMQFSFHGKEGPFWENRDLDGRAPDPQSRQWLNFGGDKTWPAPQKDWTAITGRAWPPPSAFDAIPVTASIQAGAVELVSPVDPYYGIRTRRLVRLHPENPLMTVTTIYEKVEGDPRQVSVWVITQLKHPDKVLVPVPEDSLFPAGYNRQSPALPLNLKVEGGVLSLERDPAASHKIGTDGDRMIWVGRDLQLQIESPRSPGASYPDQGSSLEVYTNRDPLPYVELETLGPLHEMKVGDQIESTSTYRLDRR